MHPFATAGSRVRNLSRDDLKLKGANDIHKVSARASGFYPVVCFALDLHRVGDFFLFSLALERVACAYG